MSKLVYQEPVDYFVQVSICSLNSFLSLNPFSVDVNAENKAKIDAVLDNSIGSSFILFPEYTYSVELHEQYQAYSNLNNCIIIGGSGLEPTMGNFYAYSPIFLPNQEDPIKVYKKHITNNETVYSEGRVIPYPNEVQREININVTDEISFTVSVFICYDFLIENKKRTDIIFVPQYEHSPQHYINEGDRISKGMRNFVLGANTANDNQRSMGFASLNSQIINAMAARNWRPPEYLDAQGGNLDHHHTTFYDIQGERVLQFRVNIGRPYSLAYTYSLVDVQPIVIPLPDVIL